MHASQVGYLPDWTQIMENIVVLNPEGAVRLAEKVVNQEGGFNIDIEAVVDLFLQVQMHIDVYTHSLMWLPGIQFHVCCGCRVPDEKRACTHTQRECKRNTQFNLH
jgi:hypothetical protein